MILQNIDTQPIPIKIIERGRVFLLEGEEADQNKGVQGYGRRGKAAGEIS